MNLQAPDAWQPPALPGPLQVVHVALSEVKLPLLGTFATSLGEERTKRAILVSVRVAVGLDSAIGWGETAAAPSPSYTSEWRDCLWGTAARHLIPALLSAPLADPQALLATLARTRGHHMARAALEAAVLDGWLRLAGINLASWLGAVRTRVRAGVAVGMAPSIGALLDQVASYQEAGYRRIKLKIQPGWDLAVIKAVRDQVGSLLLSVDANGAYTRDDLALLRRLDDLDLAMLEQPLAPDDLTGHAWLQERISTPICLDESVNSPNEASTAVALAACQVINLKPGRLGGVLATRATHDIGRGAGLGLWVGGMLETGVGRAVNLALSALPGITLPGDTSASSRYFAEDLTEPFMLDADGTIAVPNGPGIGVTPREDRLEQSVGRSSVWRRNSSSGR